MTEALYETARERQRAGALEQAAALYEQVLAAEPAHFRALNNLGVCRELDGELDAAEAAFRAALVIAPDEAPVTHNLARLLHQRDELAEAEALYRRALLLDPELAEAHFNLGRLLQESDRPLDAEATLREAVRLEPEAPEAHSFLGDALFSQLRMPEALVAYQKAVELDTTFAAGYFDVGKTLEALRRKDEAVECYRLAIRHDPGALASREGLVRALDGAGRRDEALAELRAWLAAEPGQPLATHLLAALGGAPAPERASDAYVRDTFDRFAADFDLTLSRLQYRAPQLVVALLTMTLGEGKGALAVLDAGCGTGLCGPLLKPWARHMVGVDLSGGMLERARARGVYDELREEELTAHLLAHESAYELIVSADTFCYLGDLAAPLAAAHAALRPGGLLVFTVETLESGAGFALHSDGRYAHTQSYVQEALAGAGFPALALAHSELRHEGGTPVAGMLVSATRGA